MKTFKNSPCFPPANGKMVAPAQTQGGWQNTLDGNKAHSFHLVRRSHCCASLGACSLLSLCLQEDVWEKRVKNNKKTRALSILSFASSEVMKDWEKTHFPPCELMILMEWSRIALGCVTEGNPAVLTEDLVRWKGRVSEAGVCSTGKGLEEGFLRRGCCCERISP